MLGGRALSSRTAVEYFSIDFTEDQVIAVDLNFERH